MTAIGSLVVDLIAQTASFNSNISKAASHLNSQSAKMNRSLQSIDTGIRSAAGTMKGLAAGFIGGALTVGANEIGRLARESLDFAASIGEAAQQIGVGAEALQEYRYAASQVGISQDEIDAGLTKLTRTIGEAAEGSKKQAEAFARLGISIRESNGDIKDAGAVIPEIAKALESIPDPATRAAVLVDLFGKAGQRMGSLLGNGRAEVDNLRDAARKLGVVLSEEQIQNADKTADKLDEMKRVLSYKIAGVVANNAGAILQLANALSTLVDKALAAVNAMQRFANSPIGKVVGKLNTAATYLNPLGLGMKVLTQAPPQAPTTPAAKPRANTPAKKASDQDWMKALGRSNFVMQADPAAEFNRLIGEIREYGAKSVAATQESFGPVAPALSMPFEKGGKEAATALDQLREELTQRVQQVMDSVFPDQAEVNELKASLATLDEALAAQLISPENWLAARQRLTQELSAMTGQVEAAASLQLVNPDFMRDFDPTAMIEGVDRLSGSFTRLQEMGSMAFDRIGQGLTDALFGFQSLGDAVRSLVSELANAAIQAFILTPLKASLGLPGFATGGYTGSGRGSVKGVVHGEEYVFDAAATKRIGVGNLASLQAGGFPASFAKMRPANENHPPVQIHFHGSVDERTARRSGAQAAAAYRQTLGASAKMGMAG